jgi:putative endonuclease
LYVCAGERSLRGSLDSLVSARASRGAGDGRPRDHRRAVGRLGERFALEHLQACGFTIVARNYRTHHGEIDLIVFDGCTLAFVEVKTRQARTSARVEESPLAWLSARQLARLRQIAHAWLNDRRHTPTTAQNMRFDAIGVVVNAGGALVTLEHIEGSE